MDGRFRGAFAPTVLLVSMLTGCTSEAEKTKERAMQALASGDYEQAERLAIVAQGQGLESASREALEGAIGSAKVKRANAKCEEAADKFGAGDIEGAIAGFREAGKLTTRSPRCDSLEAATRPQVVAAVLKRVESEVANAGLASKRAESLLELACAWAGNPDDATCKLSRDLRSRQEAHERAAEARRRIAQRLRQASEKLASALQHIQQGEYAKATPILDEYLAEIDDPDARRMKQLCMDRVAQADQLQKVEEIRRKKESLGKIFYVHIYDTSGNTFAIRDAYMCISQGYASCYSTPRSFHYYVGSASMHTGFEDLREIQFQQDLDGKLVTTVTKKDGTTLRGRPGQAWGFAGKDAETRFTLGFREIRRAVFDNLGAEPRYCPIENRLHYTQLMTCPLDQSPLLSLEESTDSRAVEDAVTQFGGSRAVMSEVAALMESSAPDVDGATRRLRGVQTSVGARVFSAAIRRMPVANPSGNGLVSLETYLRDKAPPGSSAQEMLGDDPVATAAQVLFGSSDDTEAFLDQVRRASR